MPKSFGIKAATWASPIKRRQFFEQYARHQGFDFLSPTAWYSQPFHKILAKKGAYGIISHHNWSIPKALIELFPTIGLEQRKFTPKKWRKQTYAPKTILTPKSKLTWRSPIKRRRFFEKYAQECGFDFLLPEAWYSQPFHKILTFKGASNVIRYHNWSIAKALLDLFPNIGLDIRGFTFKNRLRINRKRNAAKVLPAKADFTYQSQLEQVLQDLFKSEKVVYNARKKSQVTNPATGYSFEIDVWIPKLRLGFEFQDNYHYMHTWYSQRSLDIVQQLDVNKRNAAHMTGVTLILVPFWWDGAPDSLVSSIKFQRPDLLASKQASIPITLNPVPSSINTEEVPDVGTLMLASFPLSQVFSQSIAKNAWWMGEKYDGVRCCWNPAQCEVYTRSGRILPLPAPILAVLPTIFVDGEFWFGRGMFSQSYSLIGGDCSWPELRMISFDCPHHSLHDLPFEHRYSFLLNSLHAHYPLNIVAQRILCAGSFHLSNTINRVIDFGGEGVILRRVGSLYAQGRNKHLIKLKSEYGDTEGLVVAVDPKAVTLKIPSGQIFKVPLQNVHISGLQAGEVVTFSYEKLARRDTPLHPEIFRRRKELKWDDVIANSKVHHIPVSESNPEEFTSKSRGFWTFDNMREYLSNFAKNLNLDPLLAATWAKIPLNSVFESKGGRSILQKFKKNPLAALTTLFPDIRNFDEITKKFKSRTWSSPLNRRRFFEKFAVDHGFDFLSPNAWYRLNPNRIFSMERATSVLSYHKYNVPSALMDLFPDIGLERSKFKK